MVGVAVVVAGALVALSWPLLFPPPQPTAAADATPLRIFHGNLFYENAHGSDMVRSLQGVEADVLAFTEYTPEHARALLDSPLGARFPYRAGEARDEAAGTAVWSRYPLTEFPTTVAAFGSHSVLVAVDAPTPMFVFAVHPVSPWVTCRDWKSDLAALGRWDPRATRRRSSSATSTPRTGIRRSGRCSRTAARRRPGGGPGLLDVVAQRGVALAADGPPRPHPGGSAPGGHQRGQRGHPRERPHRVPRVRGPRRPGIGLRSFAKLLSFGK